LVSKKWNRIINGLRQIDDKNFEDCFSNGKIFWKSITNKLSPSKRHSHSCCRIKDYLYIFGGLSDTNTSFNDLWTLNLNRKTWSRPIADGTYPSPKACASLIAYKTSLILFGGYSHPYQYPLNQQVNFFDELHVYCTLTCTWKSKVYSNEAPKLAGHTASIIDEDKMILFGGNFINQLFLKILLN
jgi:F-box protein 42